MGFKPRFQPRLRALRKGFELRFQVRVTVLNNGVVTYCDIYCIAQSTVNSM